MIDLSQETEALARHLAYARHVTVDTAVRQALELSARTAGIALEPRPPRDRSPAAIAVRQGHIDRITRELAGMPVLDARSPQAIMDDLNAV